MSTRPRPLSAHAIEILRNMSREPMPCVAINPGVVNRLTKDGLAEHCVRPSTFKLDRGRPRSHLQITDAGRATVANAGKP